MNVLEHRPLARRDRSAALPGGARSVTRRGEGPLLRKRDLQLLAWLCEQYGARVDQLAPLLGCGPRTVQRAVARMQAAGLVQTRRLLSGEPAWVIPTSAGLRVGGQRFGLWQPRIGLLAHVAAVNDVRLHIAERSPESEWISERQLARDRESGEHLADALVLTEGRRVAIEVELTVKSKRRLTAILDELTERFDSVIYFCAPGPRRLLAELDATERWPAVGVRELPTALGGRDSAGLS